ncbi:ribosomal protein S5 domain 2-type protein [Syncephalis fuscata]|nr:ribosomal protein S5 domain 2-type protein [Syncephalis fuscata]
MATSTSPYAFTAETFKRVQPEEYYRKILEQDVRPDGRSFETFRTTIVNADCISTAEGSAVVRIGDTTVVCGIKAEVAEPTLEHPGQGYFAQVVSERLRSLLSKVIVLEDLCIEPEQAVWVIYADLTCLNYDGNIIDACVLAVSAALKNGMMIIAVNLDEEGIVRADPQVKRPVALKSFILSSTFGIYDGRLLLADPNASEEPLMDSSITVSMTANGNLASLWKNGGGRCTLEQIQQCIEKAKIRYSELSTLLSSGVNNNNN